MEDLESKLEKDGEEPEETHKKLMKLMKKAERKLKSRFNLMLWFRKLIKKIATSKLQKA